MFVVELMIPLAPADATFVLLVASVSEPEVEVVAIVAVAAGATDELLLVVAPPGFAPPLRELTVPSTVKATADKPVPSPTKVTQLPTILHKAARSPAFRVECRPRDFLTARSDIYLFFSLNPQYLLCAVLHCVVVFWSSQKN